MAHGPLDEIWSRHSAGDRLTLGEETDLLRALATSVEAHDAYLGDARLDSLLHMHARLQTTSAAFVTNVLARLAEPPPLPAARPQAPPTPEPAPQWNGFGDAPLFTVSRRPSQRDASPLIWVAVLAAVLLLATFLALSSGLDEQARTPASKPAMALDKGKPLAPPTPAPPTPVPPTPAPPRAPESPPAPAPEERAVAHDKKGVAELKQASECVWKQPQQPGDRLAPGAFELLKGTARIAFDDGAEMEVTGPARFQILGANRAFLRRGQLRAAVPEKATRFTLETPTSLLLERGTEFELQVNDGGGTDVQVLYGEIDLEARCLDGTPVETWRIGIGGSKRVEPLPRLPDKPPTAPSGSFKGVLTINGETREFNSKEEYEKARREVMRQFEEFRKRFMPNAPGPPLPGAKDTSPSVPPPTKGGPRANPGMPKAFEEAHRRLLEQFQQAQKQFQKRP